MDLLEEQQQEIEILESIYPDELNIISPNEFAINLLLDLECERKHALLLHVRYPETYPEVVPELALDFGDTTNKDLLAGEDSDEEYTESDGEDGNADESNRLLHLIETIELEREDVRELLRKIKEEAAENIGMPSVFTLASSLKDQAETLFLQKLTDAEQKMEDERVAREKEEQRKFVGTKVTPESFEAWRVKFREEMGHNKRLAERFKNVHQGRLTGKEIFDQGLASQTTELEGEGDVDISSLRKRFGGITL